MNSSIIYVVIGLLAGARVAADAAPPSASVATPAKMNVVVGDEADYALTLRDPFSPVGYLPPMSELQVLAANSAAVSNVPPPSIDLKAKAKVLLRVSGIVKRGNTYVANINGSIVRAGDEVGVTVDGQVVVFVVRAISLKRVEIEPRE
ncbi:MAG: hypothetical protein WC381_01575 [Kiritimatiellia bacterium]|jgi:hypothetical protein